MPPISAPSLLPLLKSLLCLLALFLASIPIAVCVEFCRTMRDGTHDEQLL